MTIHSHRYDNGIVLLAEPMPGAQSLSMTALAPAGIAAQPTDQQGVAPLLAEMVLRGAGDLDARAHSDALDTLGVERDTSVESTHLRLAATMIGEKLPEALPLLLDVLHRPRLPESALEPSRDLALQAIDGLDDEPQHRTFIELRQIQYPQPFNRSPLGERDHVEAITLDHVRAFHKACVRPGGLILGFAGKLDFAELRDQIGELLGDWSGDASEAQPGEPAAGGVRHIEAETAQVHIGVGYDAPAEPDEQSVLQRAAVAVLSGGMSGRLFTEVREKRGLCYAVGAHYVGHKHFGGVLAYAGTTTARARETLDVLEQELRRLAEGVGDDEFQRAVVGMKSRLVMSGESTAARSGAIAGDQWIFGRPRTLDELAAEVDAVTVAALREYVAAHPPGAMSIVTIGPEALR